MGIHSQNRTGIGKDKRMAQRLEKIDRVPDTKQAWFKDGKYGLFIHWGLYALLAGEYKGEKTDHISEWIMNSLGIPPQEYEELAKDFNPSDFDADRLVRHAKEKWGMKYLVFTAKHHEGFAMFKSESSPYNSVDATPSQRDYVRELADACRKYAIRFGLYYSQSQDWHDPNGYVAHTNGGDHMLPADNSKKDFQYYLDHKVKPQLHELLTNYGKIDLIWFDTPLGMSEDESQQVVDFVKNLQPDCIISGRVGNQLGDYMTTGDNFLPRIPWEGDWEDPATVNDTWGFNKDDENWKAPEEIIEKLVKIVSRGGNYLLNVGPRPDGRVPEKCVAVLDKVGEYVNENADALFGTRALPFYCYELDGIELTGKPNKLFLHVQKSKKRLEILNCHLTPVKAYVLKDNRPVEVKATATCEGDGVVIVELPKDLRMEKNYCVCIEMKEKTPCFEPLRG